MKRLTRYVLLPLAIYAFYLAGLGPLYSVEARGWLDFIPERILRLAWLPASPLFSQPPFRRPFSDYLDWWYLDPNAVEPPLDW